MRCDVVRSFDVVWCVATTKTSLSQHLLSLSSGVSYRRDILVDSMVEETAVWVSIPPVKTCDGHAAGTARL